jgi:transposase
LAVALIQTPNRFRTKRQLWTYSGLGLETRDSGEYHFIQGQPQRRKKHVFVRGLNKDYNHDLKALFKGAATRASVQPGPFQEFYQRSLAKGIKPTMVRLTLARKIAAITLTGSKISFLMPKSLQVRLGNQGFGVCGSFAKCGLAWPSH